MKPNPTDLSPQEQADFDEEFAMLKRMAETDEALAEDLAMQSYFNELYRQNMEQNNQMGGQMYGNSINPQA